jgi:competence protein ComGC
MASVSNDCEAMRNQIVIHPKRFQRQVFGFSTVELLVVIGLIALLIGILIPVLSKARAAANRVACMSNIRQLGAGVLQYCNDNAGWFPTSALADNGTSWEPYPEDWLHWQTNRNLMDSSIARYVSNGRDSESFKKLLRCPSDNFDGRQARADWAPGQGPFPYSYQMNDALGMNSHPYPERHRAYMSKLTSWRAPSKKIVLTEEFYPAEPAWNRGLPLTHRHGTTGSRGNIVNSSPGVKIGNNVSTFFMDGHVEGINDDLACDEAQEHADAE